MNIEVLNIEGTKSKSVNVSDSLTGLKVNYKLLKNVIDWQLNHAKKRVAKTKQRNEVIGSTKKIYAQKGTGGARHASRKAPLFVGGGIAHGPKGDNYKVKKINKKMAGHMGSKFRTLLNLEIVKADMENNLIYIKGSIPGSKNSTVFLRKSVKSINRKTTIEKEKVVQQVQQSTKKTAPKGEAKKDEPKENSKKTPEKKETKKTEVKKK